MRRPEQVVVKRTPKKHIASENVSCGYFTLLVQHEFAGGLADRCAEETGEEGMILETEHFRDLLDRILAGEKKTLGIQNDIITNKVQRLAS